MTKDQFLREWQKAKTQKIEEMTQEKLNEVNKSVMQVELKKIEVMAYYGKKEKVEYQTKELVARCPMTGQPDFYKLKITYVPDKMIPELKSFKNYLYEYFDLPITHEHLASKIYDDFMETVKPKSCHVRIRAARRGGIDTTVETGDSSLR